MEHNDQNGYRGPPYVATEEVFDKQEMVDFFLAEENAIRWHLPLRSFTI
ncbi:hypothetical protein BG24_2960 [Burkholderia pseudomallei PB08298010]|nr:hypothetical protein BG24_2960 [Burkholderia pseudomallei PB08298010]EEH25310.1 hypothetical protein BUH_1956 [Burkholderia pseudomallei Pakistan 9]KGU76794.1 hypothetical protein Y038_496 [Burkholderia pseudomallei MSHR543]